MRPTIAAATRRRRAARRQALLAAVLLLAPTLFVAGGARGQEPLVLNVGTDQELGTLNPWFAVTYADYEMFQVQYELLVGFDNNLQPKAGFADEWSSSADGMTHTFQIREGMTWSDGEPATCADAEFTYQFVLDAVASEAGHVGSGSLEPYLTNAGLQSASCTDSQTFVVVTEFPTTLITQAYVPILPEHAWGEYTPEEIGNLDAAGKFPNDPPVVGSGPYVAVEWEEGVFVRMARNPEYWGPPGVPDEIVFETFSGTDSMVRALRSGELDYVRGTGSDQFDALAKEPGIRVAEGYANAYNYLSLNTKGNTDGYNGSTSALADDAFRDALGYAIDRQALVDRVLDGHGVAGSTHVPPYHVNWHVPPERPRTFNVAEANTRLDAAGYRRGRDGIRLDAEGKPINLRLTWPDSEDHSAEAQLIEGWFGEIGIGVDSFPSEDGQLYADLPGPESGGEADWDAYMWGWGGEPDPMSLLSFFTTDKIESAINDCFYSDPRYDELYGLQQRAPDVATRKQHIAEMQQLFYDAACYHVLYYRSELHASRTDEFTGWIDQPPDTGTPLFGFGYSGYMALQDASAGSSAAPTPTATNAPASGAPGPTSSPGGSEAGAVSTPVLIGGAILLLVAIVAFILWRVRGAAARDEE